MINVVLDMGILACTNIETLEQAAFFKKRKAVIEAGEGEFKKYYFLYPGAKEFVQILHKMKNIKVSIYCAPMYSKPPVKENTYVDFVDKLAQSIPNYCENLKKIRVFTKKHRTTATDNACKENYKLYSLSPNLFQKNLNVALDNNDKLENAVLVHDNYSEAACNQAANLIWVMPTKMTCFESEGIDPYTYDSEGYRLIKCDLKTEKPFPEKDFSAGRGSRILIFKNDSDFEIHFLDRNSIYQKRLIPSQENENLIKKLNEIHERDALAKESVNWKNSSLEKKADIKIEDPNLIREIIQVVEAFDGRTKKIYRSANRIYYVAGLLFKALAESQKNNLPLSKCLFKRQFKLKKDMETYKTQYIKLAADDSIYEFGLEKLREINANLEFLSPNNFKENFKLPSDEQEIRQLKNIVGYEEDQCCIL